MGAIGVTVQTRIPRCAGGFPAFAESSGKVCGIRGLWRLIHGREEVYKVLQIRRFKILGSLSDVRYLSTLETPMLLPTLFSTAHKNSNIACRDLSNSAQVAFFQKQDCNVIHMRAGHTTEPATQPNLSIFKCNYLNQNAIKFKKLKTRSIWTCISFMPLNST